MVYDANIDLNFINSPGLKTEHERNFLLEHTKSVVRFLPQHIIGHITLGYLHKKNEDYEKANYYYKKSKELFANKKLRDTFQKYLHFPVNSRSVQYGVT